MKLKQTIEHILLKLTKRVLVAVVLISIICLVLEKFSIVLSMLLGTFFSYINMRQLMYSQAEILNQKTKNIAFTSLLMRLVLYGIPVALGLWLKDYLNLFIILVFLLSFQLNYVFLEFTKNRNRYKKRIKK